MFVNRKKSKPEKKAAPARLDDAQNEPGGRRVPTQERSRQRVERILEAAAQIFASQGHEAATMEAIAARAETSIGSIYQFFPNKAAVYQAIVRRYHDTLRGLFDTLLGGPLMDQPWSSILDASIDALASWHETDPGFRAVLAGALLTDDALTQGEAVNRELATRIAAVFAQKLPRLPAERRDFVATIAVEITSAMLILSARRPAESKAIMAEAKSVLRMYLAPYEPISGKKPASAASKVRSPR